MSSSLSTPLNSEHTLDLDFNEDQRSIAEAVRNFCADRVDVHALKQWQPVFDKKLWQDLAALGVFTPATSAGEGGALEICAIAEALGQHVFPGPVSATYLAAQLLEDDELQGVSGGLSLVSISSAGDTLLPWGCDADIFLVVDGNNIHRADKPQSTEALQTLAGETWARVPNALKIKNALAHAECALTINHIASSAYLCGAAMQWIREVSDYANTRKQFGKTLGEFQSVAHPLADCQTRLTAAQQLTRAAACSFDQNKNQHAHEYAHAAKLSAQGAALQTVYACHQVYAAIGITLEGPAFHYSRRIRQMASQAPDDALAKQQLLRCIGLGK